jgi:hypothetical protein
VFATLKLGANGVRFTIEEAQQFQANALLTKDMFRVFELDEGVEPMFKIAFDTLLDVLGIFGGWWWACGAHGGGHGGHGHGAAAAPAGAATGRAANFTTSAVRRAGRGLRLACAWRTRRA